MAARPRPPRLDGAARRRGQRPRGQLRAGSGAPRLGLGSPELPALLSPAGSQLLGAREPHVAAGWAGPAWPSGAARAGPGRSPAASRDGPGEEAPWAPVRWTPCLTPPSRCAPPERPWRRPSPSVTGAPPSRAVRLESPETSDLRFSLHWLEPPREADSDATETRYTPERLGSPRFCAGYQ